MNDLVSNYRVQINPSSKIKMYQHLFFICWYILVIYSWPYFIPSAIKLTLIIFSAIFIIFHLYMFNGVKDKKPTDELDTFFLSDLGHVEWVQTAELGQLQPSSYFWPFCFYLRIENPITHVCYWKIIYTDQIDEQSVRRLRRIIKRVKSQ